uniref:Non-specific serine/threonine protein kinase n=1 Tax=Panagrolaimus davidi TaxID=227884 RepID=A0A914Q2V5_9BILA
MESKDFEEQYLLNKYSKRIGEGSFGTVYLNELKTGGNTAVKVTKLDGDNQCEDGIFELKLMKSINKLGSIFLMELYDAKVFHGILTEKKKKAAKEKTKTPKLALLLSVAGTEEIEDFEIFNKEEMKSIIIQTSMAMATGEKKEFEHRHAHVSNIRVQREEGQFDYILNGVKYIVDKNGIKITLIDFGKSRIKDENGVLFYDWKTDQTLFGKNERYPEDPDLHFEIYDKMRQINGDDWASYNPKSNVLWIQYLVEKLTGFNEGMQASIFPPCKVIDKKGHHVAENERKDIAEISEQIKDCKSATEVVEIMMASEIFQNIIIRA